MDDQYKTTLINYVTRTHFGYGASGQLRDELMLLGIKKPLVITDKGVLEAGIVERVVTTLKPVEVFAETPSNPTEDAARKAVEQFRDTGCDGIVAIGGGSPLDMAKVVALMHQHAGPLSDYALIHGGLARITANLPAVIAVPTTAGTGSEVARAAVVIMSDQRKLVVASPYLVPKVALCDPELTHGLPAWLTAATGFDAIAHCVETYCSMVVNPPAAAIALDGLARLVANIERAVQEPGNRAARWEMMLGSLHGGLAFQKGLGAVHALSHPLGEYGLHHGTLNAILLPHVLEYNRPVLGSKIAVLSAAMGGSVNADQIEDWFRALSQRLSIPATLGALGFDGDKISEVAGKAVLDSCNATNPRTATAADYEGLLIAALG